ncbi:S-adenosyl-L-methionine-dependent methyltransferase [Penicillium hordei]|uniref:S-adenosyl-L-methionine-dependent methyltransferase n=1 Tax=Penicillium hordei TaxID=40994 RepID=A0AAD6E5P6_9EURO|nr:S-adenosyl-L-methionine-dependent methyltransferase [Penicillium hordei]KAJ5602537.1 S-adenosyl-L-methionine-dependent methyltransferase [Penicillium hordei]
MDTLLASYLHDEQARESIVEPIFQHKLLLSPICQIEPASCALDVGCGQGESSLVLALATIEFRRVDISSLLRDDFNNRPFDRAVLQNAIPEAFQLADAKVRYLCVAEYGLRASAPEQVPPVLEAHAQATFHALRKSTPEEIVSLAG